MLKSIQRKFKSLLSGSTSSDDQHSAGVKRKRTTTSEQEEEDPDVQIVRVEKKRKLNSHNPFLNFLNLPNMAEWVKLRSRNFSEQYNNVLEPGRAKSEAPKHEAGRTNGSTPHSNHSRFQAQQRPPNQIVSQGGHGEFNGFVTRHVNTGPRGGTPSTAQVNMQSTAQVNRHRKASSSSWSRQSQSHAYSSSTTQQCFRLKEREEYEKLLRLSSVLPPKNTIPSSKDSASSSSSSFGDVTFLGTSNVFNQSKNYSSVFYQPNHKRPSNNMSTSAVLDSSTRLKNIQFDEAARRSITSLVSQQRRRVSFQSRPPLDSNKSHQSTPHTSINDSIAASKSPVGTVLVKEPTKSVSELSTPAVAAASQKEVVTIIDDDEDGEAAKNTNNNGDKDQETENISIREQPVYMKADYMEKLKNSRLMHCEQWRRQVEDEELKAKAYEEKRRAQSIELEKRLKHQMRIFEDEPEVSAEILIESDSEEEADELPELTESMMNTVRSVFGKGPPGEVLSDAFRLQLTRNDLATLKGLNWLNDEVINFYMNMLMERGEQEGMPKVYAFNTFFYPKIMQSGHSAVRRWTKKVDIFSMDFILIPVHLGMHWCLCVVNMKQKEVTYYDSMHGKNQPCLDAVLKYVNDEGVAKKQQGINSSEWKLITADDNPQQMNGSDCGMFACKYAEYVTRGKPITFSQEDMPYFRHRMVYEIVSKKLLQ